MIEFSAAAKMQKAAFFAYRNDLDIFTEDKDDDKQFYVTLLRRLVGSSMKINDVFPLGCKTQVLNAHNHSQNLGNTRRKLFIVDGDLDLIIQKNKDETRDLFILDAYCIENYLIDESASLKIIFYGLGNEPMESCSALLAFETWLCNLSGSLTDLFFHLAMLREIGSEAVIKNAHHFLTSQANFATIDHNKIQDYRDVLKSLYLFEIFPFVTDADAYYTNRLLELKAFWGNGSNTLLQIVSGKDYLLPLLQFHFNSIIGRNHFVPKKNLKLFLADHCDLTKLQKLKACLLS